MIIDKILDRKNNLTEYKPRKFYNDIMMYYYSMPKIVEPIANALDNGKEKDVKNKLCEYIVNQEYNKDICKYITSVEWL